MIRLDKMEFPYKIIIKKNIIKKIDFNRYPSLKEEKKVEKKIIDMFKIKNLYVSLSNGSDEIISLYILFLKKKEKLGFFYPSFSMYENYSKLYKKKYYKIKLDNKFNICKHKKIKKCKIFFISYPNNPTGNLFCKKKILFLIKKYKKTLFIIDEAYFFYSKKTLLKYLYKYNNFIIIRTFSKIGFAGLRLGYMISNKSHKKKFLKMRSPYTLNKITLFIMNKILVKKNITKLKKKISDIIKNKKKIYRKLIKNNIEAYKSKANFILLKKTKILNKKIRNKIIFKKIFFLNKEYIRISIGTKKESNFLIKKIKK